MTRGRAARKRAQREQLHSVDSAPGPILEVRVGILEFHQERMQSEIRQGFLDLKGEIATSVTTPIKDIQQDVRTLKEKDSASENRWATARRWGGRALMVTAQVFSVVVFLGVWAKNSEVAKSMAPTWFKIWFP